MTFLTLLGWGDAAGARLQAPIDIEPFDLRASAPAEPARTRLGGDNRSPRAATPAMGERPETPAPVGAPLMKVERLDFWYGEAHALKAIDLDIRRGEVIAFIGPSGCGKSTLLKCLNRMQDETPGARHTGRISMVGQTGFEDVRHPDVDPPRFRRRFGWVAQKPNPFPTSVYENLAYPAQLHGLIQGRAETDAHVEAMLRRSGLWDELKDRLRESGTSLSGGQQQRLCIARALSLTPEVMLMDEPCGSLDPISTERIERLITSLKGDLTTVIITHNMEQARRISDRVAFFHLGRMLEVAPTERFFTAPQSKQAEGYLSGFYG